jgi:hypothetical protein
MWNIASSADVPQCDPLVERSSWHLFHARANLTSDSSLGSIPTEHELHDPAACRPLPKLSLPESGL